MNLYYNSVQLFLMFIATFNCNSFIHAKLYPAIWFHYRNLLNLSAAAKPNWSKVSLSYPVWKLPLKWQKFSVLLRPLKTLVLSRLVARSLHWGFGFWRRKKPHLLFFLANYSTILKNKTKGNCIKVYHLFYVFYFNIVDIQEKSGIILHAATNYYD